MAPSVPAETIMKLTDTKQRLSQVVDQVARGETRVIIEERGLPVAAIISAEEYQRFKAEEVDKTTRRARLEALVIRLSEAFSDVPEDELNRQVERAVQEVRSERRAEREARFAAIGKISDAFADVPLDELDREVEQALAVVRGHFRGEERGTT